MNEKKPAYKITLPLAVVLFVGGCVVGVTGKDNQSLQTVGGLAVFSSAPLIVVSIISAIRATVRNRRMRKEIKDVAASVPSASVPSASVPSVSVKSVPIQPQLTTVSYTPPQEYHGSFLSYSYNDVQIEWEMQNYEKIKTVPAGTVLSFKTLANGQVEVYHGDMKIGEMRENKLRDMARDFLKDPDRSAMAVFLSATPLLLGMYFYISGEDYIRRISKDKYTRDFKLISNKNADMQENIELCSVGDVVSLEMDYEKSKYLVYHDGLEIGYMPASFNKSLQEHSEAEYRIKEIVEPEEYNGKYEVFVIAISKE